MPNTTTAESILNPELDRTPKERRNMAEFYAVHVEALKDKRGYQNGEVCYFRDGSMLLMDFDEDYCPTQFLVM